jgi:hypothetical protein
MNRTPVSHRTPEPPQAPREAQVTPEVLLPVQYGGGRRLVPEEALMLAVLQDGVDTFRRYRGVPGRRARRLFAEADAWLRSEDTTWPYAIVNICDALGLDVAWLRGVVVRPGPVPPVRSARRHAA